MKTTKTPLKKRKLDAPFKPPATSAVDLTLTDASQQQQDSQTLESCSQKPIKPNGSKLDAIVEESLEEDSDSESLNSAEAQDEMRLEEERMYAFRAEARNWLADHGKAFFHVEFLQFAREQEKKKKKDPLSDITPSTKRTVVSRFK